MIRPPSHHDCSLSSVLSSQSVSGVVKSPFFEQVGIPGPLGLILALQHQPVIVKLRADHFSFVAYTVSDKHNPP